MEPVIVQYRVPLRHSAVEKLEKYLLDSDISFARKGSDAMLTFGVEEGSKEMDEVRKHILALK